MSAENNIIYLSSQIFISKNDDININQLSQRNINHVFRVSTKEIKDKYNSKSFLDSLHVSDFVLDKNNINFDEINQKINQTISTQDKLIVYSNDLSLNFSIVIAYFMFILKKYNYETSNPPKNQYFSDKFFDLLITYFRSTGISISDIKNYHLQQLRQFSLTL